MWMWAVIKSCFRVILLFIIKLFSTTIIHYIHLFVSLCYTFYMY